MNNTKFKYAYKALTGLNPVEQKRYHQFLLLKFASATQKPGFIRNDEKALVAKNLGLQISALQRRLKQLVEGGYITKNKFGYNLTSTATINKKLNLEYKKQNGKEHTPFFKIELPFLNEKIISELRLYYLILQTYRQYCKMNASAITPESRNSRFLSMPENFTVSLDKLKEKGKYSSHTIVDELISRLQTRGVIERFKGNWNFKNNSYDCNKYTLLPIEKGNWSDKEEPVKTKAKKKSAKRKAIYNAVEERFSQLLERGWKKQLIELGLVSSFYSKRKISKTMFSKLLIAILNNSVARTNFLKHFTEDEILITKKESVYIDSFETTYVYDRMIYFVYDKVELVLSGGNFSDYEDEQLITQKDNWLTLHNNRKELYHKRLFERNSKVIITDKPSELMTLLNTGV